MRILKIYIQNFKWIENKEFIDLERDITFLTWPNGFWKTTIFDVIEICLTWELYRVTNDDIETSKIVDWRTKVWKPFYQNNGNKPVLLKLLIELKDWTKKIVIAYDNSTKWRDKPAKLYFKRFIEDYIDDDTFYSQEDWFNRNNSLDNSKLWELLKLKKGEDISNIYKIFNYLQQEETTFFLKQSAHNRHGNLNFLFKTKDEYDKQKKIETFRSRIIDISTKLENRVSEIKDEIDKKRKLIGEKEEVKYSPFFDNKDHINSKNIDFDKEEIFNKELWDENIEYKEIYLNDLRNIKEFLNNFDSEEYIKKISKDALIKIRSNEDFLQYYLLQKFDSKDEYLRLENYNNISSLLQKRGYLEYLIYEKFLIKDEFELIESRAFLYGLCEKDKNSIIYFILQDILSNKEYLQELVIKNNLLKYANKDDDLLDVFLLWKFNDRKIELENNSNIYNALKSNNNTLIKCIVLNQFFRKLDKNSLSIYEELERFYNKYQFLKSFKLEKQEQKIKEFAKILSELGVTDSIILTNFNDNIRRKKELESDLNDNDKIISELNDLRKNLLSFYEWNVYNKVSLFDKTCLLCWTSQVVNDGTNKEIENLDIFKLFVEEKTSNISKVSYGKTKDLDLINLNINNSIKELENTIDVFIGSQENKEKITLFENIAKYLNKGDYERNIILVESILRDNPNISIEKPNFENLDQKIDLLNTEFLKKYESNHIIFSRLSNLKWQSNSPIINDILESFLIKKNINFSISSENFDNSNYLKKIDEIRNEINTYIKWFNQPWYFILESLINSENIKLYKDNTIKLNNFLWENTKNFLIKDLEANLDLNLSISKVNKEIKENTVDYFILYQKINPLKKQEMLLKIEELDLIRSFVQINKLKYSRLENVEDFTKELDQKLLLSFHEEISTFLKNKLFIFNTLVTLRKNKEYDQFHVFNEKIKESTIDGINDYILKDYDDYFNFTDSRNKTNGILYGFIENIKIDDKKLWWSMSYIIDVFWKNIELIKKYQHKKDKLNNKYQYIEYKYFELENTLLNNLESKYQILNTRLNKIWKKESKETPDSLVTKLDILINIYDDKIKDYKKKMVNGIKMPFFIYTAKILQNFQQWMWIYISVKFENGEWENYKNETIVFHSDWKSENDIMHQLSSWQLAVVSLAFTLSINKVYNLSEELNFMNIDDPIQELDSLNIHSFIELIRHNFLDYIFIMSTHSDENAYFMKYKIEKIKWENTVNLLNVQNKFFPAGNADLVSEELENSNNGKN
jgi:DNA repair exonuclease SbcCD ATPase subunit